VLHFSTTHDRKSKSHVASKNHKVYLRHNCFSEDIPVVRHEAVGRQSDKAVLMSACGSDEDSVCATDVSPVFSFVYGWTLTIIFIFAKAFVLFWHIEVQKVGLEVMVCALMQWSETVSSNLRSNASPMAYAYSNHFDSLVGYGAT
jgi:hypothetical protein